MRLFLAACCALLAACSAAPETNVAAAPGGHILIDDPVTVAPLPPIPAGQSFLIDLGYYPVQTAEAATESDGIRGVLRPTPAAATAPGVVPTIEGAMADPAPAPIDPAIDDISRVQALLDDMGYAPGPIDGIIGPLTWAAIETFQARHGHAPADDIAMVAAQLETARLIPEAQQLLTELGYVPGPIDGITGPLTRAAMSAFQTRYGLEQDGIVSAESLATLRTVATLREIQIRLAGLGYDPGPADGILGPRTKQAILFFERDRRLPHVGWASAVVRERLREAPYIEETQRLLAVLGYDAGPVTGLDNEQTRVAIRAFQAAANLPRTGRASADLLLMIQTQAQARLSPAAGPIPAPPPVLQQTGLSAPVTPPTALLARLLPLAEDGAPSAQHLIANLYMSGQGVPTDLPTAIGWYERAANQGFAPAQYRLGLIYAFGIGIDSDPSTAGTWFDQAAANGHPGAAKALAMLNDEVEPEVGAQ